MSISNTEYSKWSQALMRALVNLHGMNAEAVLDSTLPRIVVIGEQSAGKSSVVEAVTGVRVPRDAGTCTRCPMELSMFSTGEAWTCDIHLQLVYDSSGQPLHLSDVKKIPFGETLSDIAQVEPALRRAQAAILNPMTPVDVFLSISEEELTAFRRPDASKKTLKFSKNTIGVTIHDPNGSNLTFLDLPGLITNEEPDVVNLVKELTVSEIKKENSLILVTIPMTGDMEVQTAVRLAREVDPEGLRTIGVLTKPDAVPKGASSARRTWMEVLSNRERVLIHGYYCLRLPDDDERVLNLPMEAYYKLARQFFEKEAPWNTLTEKHRLGVPGLVADLSKHLTVLIAKALPKLSREVQQSLERCQVELDALPPAPKLDSPAAEILNMINGFCLELKALVLGSDDDRSVVQDNRESYDRFLKAIQSTAPRFIPREDAKGKSSFNGVVNLKREQNGEDESDLNNDADAEPLYLSQVRLAIKKSLAWELPHNTPFHAKEKLIKNFTNLWTSPSIFCFEEVLDRLATVLQQCVVKHFEYYNQLQLYISSIVDNKLQETKDSALRAVENALRLEQELYFTQNLPQFNVKRDLWLSKFKEKRRLIIDEEKSVSVRRPVMGHPSPPGSHPNKDDFIRRAISALAEAGYDGLAAKDLGRLVKPDPFEEEMIVMADVMAYFHVAYKRVIDHIPLTIELSLNRALCADLESWLVQKLDIGGPDAITRLKALISQDPHITATRDRLTAEISKLKDIQKELRSLRLLQQPSNSHRSMAKDLGFVELRSNETRLNRPESVIIGSEYGVSESESSAG